MGPFIPGYSEKTQSHEENLPGDDLVKIEYSALLNQLKINCITIIVKNQIISVDFSHLYQISFVS